MSKPRKPTQLHIISGSARTHPERMAGRKDEPVSGGADLRDAPAPGHLGEVDAKLWDELRRQLHARVAYGEDAIAFEALVRLVQHMRSGKAVAADYARLQSFLGEFGMTPAAKSKISQGKASGEPKGFAALRGSPFTTGEQP